MTNQWVLRDEIIRATHRWPVIVLFCLTGSLLGWIIAFGQPSPHRATKEMLVGLNIQQASKDSKAAKHAGVKIRNSNDYKNWQMASLNSLIFMDSIIDETLTRLRETDTYWTNVDRNELAAMLHIYWRNAGKWRLVAEADDPERASQAVTAWQGVVVEQANAAINYSQNALVLDRQLQSIVSIQTQAQKSLAEKTEIRNFLNTWRANASREPANQPADSDEHWLLYQTLANGGLGESWAPMLEAFPPPDAVLQDYSDWVERATALLEQEILILQAQIETLESEKQHVAQQYAEASQKSLGLSPDLVVDRITDDQPELSVVRPTGWLMLIGSAIGLICWATVWFARITLQVKA
jgi:hypothetical protein